MTKTVRCRDLGFDCDGVVRAPTEQDALQEVADHARQVHGVDPVPPQVVQRVREVMRDE